MLGELRQAGEALAPAMSQHDSGLLQERCSALDRRLANAQDKVDKKLQVCATTQESQRAVHAALDDVVFQLQNLCAAAEAGAPLNTTDTLAHLKVGSPLSLLILAVE